MSPSSFLTDPYLYQKLYYEPFNYTEDTMKYVHPYLTYSRSKHMSRICNRCYCKECFQTICNKSVPIDQFVCNYCEGICNCNRCCKMNWIVKMLGLYVNLNGNIE